MTTLPKFSPANGKLQKLAKALNVPHGRKVYSFDLLAGHSCPGARDCQAKVVVDDSGKRSLVTGKDATVTCFAASLEALYGNVYAAHDRNFAAIRAAGTEDKILSLLVSILPKNCGVVRWHSFGDFFSRPYLAAAYRLAAERPDIHFYAYTKSLPHLAKIVDQYGAVDLPNGRLRQNFMVTASRGGRYDELIAKLGMRESVIVRSEIEAQHMLLPVDNDDSHAALAGGSFALVIHGAQRKIATDRYKAQQQK